jgi:hypothetical protein
MRVEMTPEDVIGRRTEEPPHAGGFHKQFHRRHQHDET